MWGNFYPGWMLFLLVDSFFPSLTHLYRGPFPGKADSPGSLPNPLATIWREKASVVSSSIPRGVPVRLHLSLAKWNQLFLKGSSYLAEPSGLSFEWAGFMADSSVFLGLEHKRPSLFPLNTSLPSFPG